MSRSKSENIKSDDFIPAVCAPVSIFAGSLKSLGRSHGHKPRSSELPITGTAVRSTVVDDPRIPNVEAENFATAVSAESKKGSTGTRSWRLASGLAEWISESQVTQRTAASALQVTAAGACSQTSQTMTRSWRVKEWILVSQVMHKKAESARQNTAAATDLQASQERAAAPQPPEIDLMLSNPNPINFSLYYFFFFLDLSRKSFFEGFGTKF